jgi:hypothetical protein
MFEQFSIGPNQVKESSGSALRDEIHARTQNTEETARILSALERFGVDPSIDRFDIVPSQNRGFRGATGTSWTVKASRKRTVVVDPIPGA